LPHLSRSPCNGPPPVRSLVSIELRRPSLAINHGSDVALPLADDAVPFRGGDVVVNRLVEIELWHVQADDPVLEDSVGEDALLAKNQDRQPQLISHRRLDMRPRRRQPAAVDRFFFQSLDIRPQSSRSLL